ncbi:MAG: hypothetical protein IPJ81_19500 [Chitinophagaceae bacterium]|nr:hypothetical protein [Chitinophagaceae bacterium]
MRVLIIYSIFFLLFVSSCKVAKYLPPGEKLYKGSTIKVKKEGDVKNSARSLKKLLGQAVRPKPNKFILGQPYKVWWWYVIGEPKKQKGIKKWLRDKLGEPPVLGSRVNAVTTAENMTAFLENLGYFHSTVAGDMVNKNYFTKAVYEAKVFQQYTIKNITWVSESSTL